MEYKHYIIIDGPFGFFYIDRHCQACLFWDNQDRVYRLSIDLLDYSYKFQVQLRGFLDALF